MLRLRNRKRQKSALNLQIMDQIYRLTRVKKYIHSYLTASGVQFTVEGFLVSTRTTLNKTLSKSTNEEATPSHPTTPNHTSKYQTQCIDARGDRVNMLLSFLLIWFCFLIFSLRVFILFVLPLLTILVKLVLTALNTFDRACSLFCHAYLFVKWFICVAIYLVMLLGLLFVMHNASSR